MLRINLIFGLLALFPSGLGAATFAFALRPEGTRLAGEFALTADAAGSLRGDHDPSTNAGGTRTKPGLFGSFGSTENLPVPVELTSALSGPLDSKPTGGFQLQLNEEAGTIILSGLSLNLLPGDPVVVPSELVIEFGSFRTRSPDSLFIGGFPLTVPLGEARLTSLAAAQIGSAAGDLSAASIGLWDFSISTLLLVSGSFESTLGETLLPPVPVPYTLSGRISMSGDSAMVTAVSDFGFSQSTDVDLGLPSLPFDLPTILPAGGSANVVLDLSLNSLVAELDATLTLAAPGRAIPEPASAALTVGGLLWMALQRRRSRAISIRQRNRLVLFLSFWLINANVQAAPVNDAYASALVLPAALPVEASGPMLSP